MEDSIFCPFVLVPIRRNERLWNNSNDDDDESLLSSSSSSATGRRRLPFVTIQQDTTVLVGRIEFLHAVWEACLRKQGSKHCGDFQMECGCSDCRQVTEWAVKFLSRKLLKITTSTAMIYQTHIELQPNKESKYPLECMQIVTNLQEGGFAKVSFGRSPDDENIEEARTIMKPGDILQLRKEANDEAPILEFELVRLPPPRQQRDEQQATTPSSSSSPPQLLETQAFLDSPSGTSQQRDVVGTAGGSLSPQLETQKTATASLLLESTELSTTNSPPPQQTQPVASSLPSNNVHPDNVVVTAVDGIMAKDTKSGLMVEESSRKRQRHSNNRLSLGTFASGTSIYRNRLHPGETFDNGHVGIDNLVLPDCTSALLTTYIAEPESTTWLTDLLDGIGNVIVVRGRGENDNQLRAVGDGELIPMNSNNNSQHGWYWLTLRTHTKTNLFHAKMMLFRNVDGLRVVVCGSNLYQGQWEIDRDILWVQDFNVDTSTVTEGIISRSIFRKELRTFLDKITFCRQVNDQARVQKLLQSLLNGINFSTATARLVFSLPAPQTVKDFDRGGWHQLARCVRSLLDEIKSSDNRSSNIKKDKALVYAMAGSFGDVKPEFIIQMHRAMCGIDEKVTRKREWDEAASSVRCLWPSRETALTMNLHAFVDRGRAVPMDHWQNIPEKAKRNLFFDALPNPKEIGLPHMGCHAFSHAKVLFKAGGDVGVVYVGSHNFSSTAWGIRDVKPKNVEVGIVLASASDAVRQEWRDRLPCLLPDEGAQSASGYIPASAHQGIRNTYQAGNFEEAIHMLKDWLKSDRSTGSKEKST